MTPIHTRPSPSEFKKIAFFLASINKLPQHNIGYCGENELEILTSLNEDFLDNETSSILLNYHNEDIQSLIGLDIDGDSAEVWGPFSISDNPVLQMQIFLELQILYPHIQKFHFFINQCNINQLNFMSEIGSEKKEECLLLEVFKQKFEAAKFISSRKYQPSDYNEFKKLHENAFPATYYNADTIVERVHSSKNNVLKIIDSQNKPSAYAYYEIDAISKEAHLHYLAVHTSERGKGMGTLLLKEILTEIFSIEGIDKITLCVDNDNEIANHVYFKVGFTKKAILYSYLYKKGY